MSNLFVPGTRVQCGVYVGHEYRPTYVGVVKSVESGYCRVDIGSPHGASPWIVNYTNAELRETQP